MNDPVLNKLLHTSDTLLALGIIEHPSARPDRVSRIQSVPFVPVTTSTRPSITASIVAVATAGGTTREVAALFGISIHSVRSYRSRYRAKSTV